MQLDTLALSQTFGAIFLREIVIGASCKMFALLKDEKWAYICISAI